MNKIFVGLGVCLIGVSLLVGILNGSFSPRVELSGNVTGDVSCLGMVAWTHTSSTVNTTATQVVASSTARQCLKLWNLGPNTMFCKFDNQTAASSTVAPDAGIPIYTSSTAGAANFLEIGPDNLYRGAINCVSKTAAGTISIVEK